MSRERTGSGQLSAEDAGLEVGSRLGRFRIIRHLGRGGMGAVYEAEDTVLERRVAMKVVASLSESGRTRMLSEARALAQIKHANVVQLHDVGVEEDHVYLALELVRGTTLARHLASSTHDWADIVVHFVAAGRGLAEAHGAGLAHGDFKPSNVLVATDGRVLVSDFGLAQSMETETTLSGHGASTQQRQRIVGTPAYMAPELFRGANKAAASDQFAFCVALYEALYGEHPFGGGSWEKVARSIAKGGRRVPPPDAGVPRHLRRAVLRGLSHRPEHRWPSMNALLTRLMSPEASRTVPRSVLALGALAAVGAAGFTLAGETDPCDANPQLLDGTWDDNVRSRVALALVGAAPSDRPQVWDRVESSLDDWSRHWLKAHHDVCVAARDRDGDDTDLDLRMACLKSAGRSFQTLTSVLEQGDQDSAWTAMAGVAGLPSPQDCATAASVALLPHARDAANEELFGDIERGNALARVGRLFDAEAIAKDATERAQTLGSCGNAVSAGLLLGSIQREQGHSSAARERFVATANQASECGRDDLAAKASLQVAETIAQSGVDASAARTWLASARTAAAQVSTTDTEHRRLFDARALVTEARIDTFAQDYEIASGHLNEGLALLPAFSEGDLSARIAAVRAPALELRGQIALRQGNYEQAQQAFGASLDLRETIFGNDNPRTAAATVGLATVSTLAGDTAKAIERLEQALSLIEAGYGPAHPRIAVILNNLAAVEADRNDITAARRYLLRAIDILAAHDSERPGQLITMRVNAATLAAKLGDLDTAVREAEAAARDAEIVVGRQSRPRALALRVLAASQNSNADFAGAARSARQAVAILEARGETVVLHDMRALLAEVLSHHGGNEVEVLALLKPVRAACATEQSPVPTRACARALFFTAVSLPDSTPDDVREQFVGDAKRLLEGDERIDEYRPFHDRVQNWPGPTH